MTEPGKANGAASNTGQSQATETPLGAATASGDAKPPGSGSAASSHPASAKQNVAAVLGQVVWLMMQAPAFRHTFLIDLEWMVLPPLVLGQYHILHDKGRPAAGTAASSRDAQEGAARAAPVAFAAWAYVSAEVEARLQQPNPKLKPDEWKSGDHLWLVEMIAPFGHAEAMVEALKTTALAGKSFKFQRRNVQGKAMIETVG